MFNQSKKGFTLVELLAVIVILAIILAIAIPGISSIINSATEASFESDAKMVLKGIEYKVLENDAFDPTTVNETNVETLLNLSNDNYQTLTVKKIDDRLYIIIVGKNKWSDLVASGTNIKMHVDKNLLLWLEGSDFLNTPQTTIWNDRSGNGNNSVPTNFGYSINSGSNADGGVVFDGIDDYVKTPLVTPVSGTIEAVFTPKSFYDYNTLWENEINSDSYEGWIYATGSLAARSGNGSTSTTATVEADKEQQIVFTWDDLTKTQKIYINGTLINTNSGLVTTNRSTLNVGGNLNTPSNGVYKSFKVYSRVLTATEILEDYNNNK